jgi:hypothetical protein
MQKISAIKALRAWQCCQGAAQPRKTGAELNERGQARGEYLASRVKTGINSAYAIASECFPPGVGLLL